MCRCGAAPESPSARGGHLSDQAQQALAMLEHAWASGVPMRGVTGDEVYGDAPRRREAVQKSAARRLSSSEVFSRLAVVTLLVK